MHRADEGDWRDAWIAEGVGSLLGCRLLGEHTTPSIGSWSPALDPENTTWNAEAAGRPVIGYTAPGFRRPRHAIDLEADGEGGEGRLARGREGYRGRR